MNQSEKIISVLEKAGENGVPNYILNNICFRYSARINELRNQGWKISKQHVRRSVWKYILHKD